MGVAIAGSVITGQNAKREQQEAADRANATQREMYDQTRADQQPWMDAGKSALSDLTRQMPELNRSFGESDFKADPGYAFRMAEGQKAIERSAAARGGLSSGGTLKALTRYGQDTASNEYQNAYSRFTNDQSNRFNRLASLSGVGQASASNLMGANQNYGNQVSQNQLGMGNANAAYQMGIGNTLTGLTNQAISGGTMVASGGMSGGAGAARGGSSASGMMFSDERLKTDIVQISKADLQELRETIKPYAFKYKSESHGDGDWIGVMAQDLEKSKLGRTIVCEDAQGNKQVDLKKAMSLFLATMAEG